MIIQKALNLILIVGKSESKRLLSNLWYAVREILPHSFLPFEFEQNVVCVLYVEINCGSIAQGNIQLGRPT